jgi:hypothetical protein
MSSLRIVSRSTTLGGTIGPPEHNDPATVDQSWVEQRAAETRTRIAARSGPHANASIQALADKADAIRAQLAAIEGRATSKSK